jgi:hypothetical protein
MRFGWLLAPVALLVSPAEAKGPIAWPDGIYSNVHAVAETGDMLGLEIRFYRDGERHMAEFVSCEGWCNDTYVAEVVRGDSGFTLDYSEMFTGASGEVPVDMHIVLWPAGRVLNALTYQGRENTDTDGKPQRLRLASKLFGIAVAKSGKD